MHTRKYTCVCVGCERERDYARVWREGEVDRETGGTHETKKPMRVWEIAKMTKRLREIDKKIQQASVRECARERERRWYIYKKGTHKRDRKMKFEKRVHEFGHQHLPAMLNMFLCIYLRILIYL